MSKEVVKLVQLSNTKLAGGVQKELEDFPLKVPTPVTGSLFCYWKKKKNKKISAEKMVPYFSTK